jgi:hypothetical protein
MFLATAAACTHETDIAEARAVPKFLREAMRDCL